MIKKISIKNFKAWKDTGEIELAPITIFCGTNSSGKSSIGQLLLMLKQTMESDDRAKVLEFGESGSIVNLGTFKDVVFGHDTNTDIEFQITFDTIQPIQPVDPSKSQNLSKNKFGPYHQLELNAKIGINGKGLTALVKHLRYNCNDGVKPVSFGMERTSNGSYELISSSNYPLKKRKNTKQLPAPVKFYGFPAESTLYYGNVDFLPDFSNEVNKLFINRLFYVGPLRQNPEREYAYTGDYPPHVGYKGERAIHALLASEKRKVAFYKNRKYSTGKPIVQVVAEWLKEMKLIWDFKIEPIAENRKEHEVKIWVNEHSAEVLITDVGFGISQILPVLVQSIYCHSNATVLFEQPEIHLHPSVQAELADVFIKAKKVKESSKERNTQFIIESHSEHLVRRIQRRVAEQLISPDEVAIYFVEQKSGQAKIEKLEMDEFGNISNWPKHFFGDDMEDIAATIKATIQREKK